MSSAETTESPQIKFMRSFIQAYEKRDLSQLAKYWHKNLRRIIYPRSLGLPEETKEEWAQHITELMNLWTGLEVTTHSMIDAPGKVITHLTAKANTSIGVEMIREVIFIAHIASDDDGTLKVIKSEEFTDSKTYLEFFKAVAAAKAGKEYASYAA